ncbi:L-asparaginase [Cladorrhinum samala]|uniref:L-asparaginase n=1 Tax=Cladorrhinum samala TaxID=585594 RepID=A0AAV9I1E6_9PEZI|nr:L-asparaginase [Cladorrhinum samala]
MDRTSKMEYAQQSRRDPKFQPRIIIHGGAGNITPANLPPKLYEEYRSSLLTIVSKTHSYMHTPLPSSSNSSRPALPSALAVSTYAVTLLENNPLFNAGHGAVFTRDGTNELEASVMVSRGRSKRGVGVTGLKHVRNPILLAKALLEHGDEDLLSATSSSSSSSSDLNVPSAQGHTLLHGETAEVLAGKYGLELVDPSYFYTQKRWDEHVRALQREKDRGGIATWSEDEYLPQGTVGAVALDEDGVVCAATSTGGMTNKLTGRIGDTPSVGSGFWAEEWEESEFPSQTLSPASPAVILGGALRRFMADCLPSPFLYSPTIFGTQGKKVIRTKALAVSGTGNGDSFLRIAAARTIGAVARWGGHRGTIAASKVAGPGGELQKSAGDRWGKTGEGQGGIIGIEAIVTRDAESGDVVGTTADLIQEFNCGGLFRAWVDQKGIAYARVWRDQCIISSEYSGEGEGVLPRNWDGGKLA